MVDVPRGRVDDTEATAHQVGADVETWRGLRTIVVDTSSVRAAVVTLAV